MSLEVFRQSISKLHQYVIQFRKEYEALKGHVLNKLETSEISIAQVNDNLVDLIGEQKGLRAMVEKLELRVNMLSDRSDQEELRVDFEVVEAALGEVVLRVETLDHRDEIVEVLRGDVDLLTKALIQYTGYVNQLVGAAMLEEATVRSEYKKLGYKLKQLENMERRDGRKDYANILKQTIRARNDRIKSLGGDEGNYLPGDELKMLPGSDVSPRSVKDKIKLRRREDKNSK